MKRTACVLLLLAAGALAQAQNVRITWIGQSCFVIQTEGGPMVVTDPPVASTGYPLPALTADVVTVSHNHTDHNYTAGVGGQFTVVDGRPVTARTEMTAAQMPFLLLPGWHDNQKGAQRGQNTMIRWTQSGVVFAHMGDFGEDQLSDEQLAGLRNADVLFVPSGGFYTVDADRAAALVKQLKPRVAIPMHFRTALGGPAQLAAFPDAVRPLEPLVYKPSRVTVNRTTLPASAEVWVMEVAADVAAVNAASSAAGVPVAPGSLVSLYGAFVGAGAESASAYPLPRLLGESEVLVGGKAAPLMMVSPSQINFQLPAAQQAGQAVVEARVKGERVARGSVTVLEGAPGLFALGRKRVRRGEALEIYATGGGRVTPPVEDGAAAPAQPLSATLATPAVYLDGRLIPVTFSGLAPGVAGLWQVNAAIPADASPGPDVSVLIIHGGIVSNQLSVAVE
ncbi:MAG: MBL fold metallo-hydrolase [Acidobacteria bacterium]|nr:MBL fold metallo-hydrolase [Acidobacteriota bacterium]